jgi:hypothetical protein
MITWSQSKGLMTNHDGVPIGKGYAGNGLGKDNPEDQGLQGIGPVPQGVWNIGQPHLGVRSLGLIRWAGRRSASTATASPIPAMPHTDASSFPVLCGKLSGTGATTFFRWSPRERD